MARRWFIGSLLLLLVPLALGGYVAYASWAYRDLPVAELERIYGAQTHGDESLRQADIDGVAIRYRIEGQPLSAQPLSTKAPILVLIHSHYFEMGLWDSWVERLAADYTLIRYDLSGHGLTGPDPAGHYSVARDTELLAALLESLQVESATLIGSSLGGNIAFTYAARHPQRTSALVLINSGGLRHEGSRSGQPVPAWVDWVFPLLPELALRRFLTWMVADDQVISDAVVQRFMDMWRREGNRGAELARLRSYSTGEPDTLLASIRAPTLILWGRDNPQLPPSLAGQFERKLSAAPLVETRVYEGVGHVLPLEKPDAVEDVRLFLVDKASPLSTLRGGSADQALPDRLFPAQAFPDLNPWKKDSGETSPADTGETRP